MDHKQNQLANFESHWQIILEIGMGLFSVVPGSRRTNQEVVSQLIVNYLCYPLEQLRPQHRDTKTVEQSAQIARSLPSTKQNADTLSEMFVLPAPDDTRIAPP
jgi:hypothetical protein